MYRKKIKTVFLMSRLLGGKTFSNWITSAVSDLPEIDPIFVFFDVEDWGRYPLPARYKLFKKFVPAQTARLKFDRHLGPERFDFMFIQSFELILGFGDKIKKKPTILAHDSTDVLGHWIVFNESARRPIDMLKFRFKNAVTKPLFKKIVKNVDVFMPRTAWCASSLIKDYHVSAERIIIAPGGIDVKRWKQKCYVFRQSPKLLFVGNDFERKGGCLLLRLYSHFLKNLSELTIVSNDPILANISLPRGVKLIQGLGHEKLEKLIEIYRDADLFVFPTRNDRLGLVLLEAAATGLPIVATDLAGISEVVKNGVNGYLISSEGTLHEWAEKITDLILDSNKRERFGRESRRLAEGQFSSESLKRKLRDAFSRALRITTKDLNRTL